MTMLTRRKFLRMTSGSAAFFGGASALKLFGQLQPVHAAEAQVGPATVKFHPEIEPLVRFLEDTPRNRLLEEMARRIQRGLTYREVLSALLLAGIRNIQPRPVGFKFHAVLVVNSAHLASLSAPDSERWLPIFWALDYFKSSQEADEKAGDWTMRAAANQGLPSSEHALTAFREAMDNWDEPAADLAVTAMARHLPAHEIFEILCRYGARDFRDIGHKAIYVANSFRLLEVIGWQHAEPVLRSLAYALLDRGGAADSPAKLDLPEDRPFRRNLEVLAEIPAGWREGRRSEEASFEMLQTIRQGSAMDASGKALGLLKDGIAPESIYEGFFAGAAEMLVRAPGIRSLHASTCSNALHYAWQRTRDDRTRRLLFLQNASFLPLFRGNAEDKGFRINELSSGSEDLGKTEAVQEVFTRPAGDKLATARKAFAVLTRSPDAGPLVNAARRLIFLKGRDSHDYKFSSAVLEDYHAMSSPWRERFLAASMVYFPDAQSADNDLTRRTRAALG